MVLVGDSDVVHLVESGLGEPARASVVLFGDALQHVRRDDATDGMMYVSHDTDSFL